MFQPLNAKVEAPNYDFSLKSLDVFFPQKTLEAIGAKHGKGEEITGPGSLKTHKFYVAHVRYKFPVLIQEKGGVVQDFFARLPSYFLHDVFFQSLVNRLGEQTSYKKVEEEAIYVWEKDGLRHVYSAACTITCFPIFYAVHQLNAKSPLLKLMKPSKL